jgi:hypothetical protein
MSGRRRQSLTSPSRGFPRGTEVKVNTPTEPRFHGKKDIVTSHNMGEIGVRLGITIVWYLPSELRPAG